MRLAIRNTAAGRSLGSPSCAAATVDVAFPAAPPLMGLIDDLCAAGGKRATLVLADVPSGATKEVSGLEVRQALLTEVRFPALGGGAKDPLRLTLVFQGESSRTVAIEPPAAGFAGRLAVVTALQFEVPGVDLSGVNRLEPFSIKRPVETSTMGPGNQPAIIPSGRVEFPGFLATLPADKAADLAAWRDAAVNGSMSTAQNKKNGSLNLLSASSKIICTLEITGLGIMRLSVVPTASPATRTMQAEFLCDRIKIVVPPASAEGSSHASFQ
jgi:hypothetical protein